MGNHVNARITSVDNDDDTFHATTLIGGIELGELPLDYIVEDDIRIIIERGVNQLEPRSQNLRVMVLDVNQSDTIKMVKAKMQYYCSADVTSPNRAEFIFEHKTLEDDKHIYDYGIDVGNTLYLRLLRTDRRRLASQRLINRFIKESDRCRD